MADERALSGATLIRRLRHRLGHEWVTHRHYGPGCCTQEVAQVRCQFSGCEAVALRDPQSGVVFGRLSA